MVARPPIELSNLGMWDSMILMILALVVFGPRRLPQIGRQIGKLMYEFRKASNDFKFQMEEELRVAEDADRRKREEAERARNLALNPPAEMQTVEAQADIGAEEQVSVSAPPPPAHFGEADKTEAEALSPEPEASAAAAAAEVESHYPRISPPATGEPIAASRPNSGFAAPAEVPAETHLATESNVGAQPEASAPEGAGSHVPPRTETVTQHG